MSGDIVDDVVVVNRHGVVHTVTAARAAELLVDGSGYREATPDDEGYAEATSSAPAEMPPPAGDPVDVPTPTLDELVARAEALGVKVDKRLGAEKLAEKLAADIAAAEAAIVDELVAAGLDEAAIRELAAAAAAG